MEEPHRLHTAHEAAKSWALLSDFIFSKYYLDRLNYLKMLANFHKHPYFFFNFWLKKSWQNERNYYYFNWTIGHSSYFCFSLLLCHCTINSEDINWFSERKKKNKNCCPCKRHQENYCIKYICFLSWKNRSWLFFQMVLISPNTMNTLMTYIKISITRF